MDYITEKFSKLGCDNAPGQETLQKQEALPMEGEPIPGTPVAFSHGAVDAHKPIPGSLEKFVEGYVVGGGHQAYTEYRGKSDIRAYLAQKLAEFSGAPVDAASELILTPGTQGALFLAMGSLIGRGDKVAIIEPDYFANRKLVEFFDGELVPVPIHWKDVDRYSGLDLEALEKAFQSGVKVFLYSNPNNPTGVIYSPEEVAAIGRLAKKYNVAVIADELYSRQLFDKDQPYTHLRALEEKPDTLITIIGPSNRVPQRLPPGRGLRLRPHHHPHGEAPGHRLPADRRLLPVRLPQLVLRARGMDGEAGGRPQGHPGRPAEGHRQVPRLLGPSHRGGQLHLPPAPRSEGHPGPVRQAVPGSGRRHRHPRHRVRAPVHRQRPPELLPGPPGRRSRRGAHLPDGPAVPRLNAAAPHHQQKKECPI